MWILHFLPDSLILWFTNAVLLLGIALTIAGLFAHRIPIIWQYQVPFKVLGIALLALGVYFRGGYSVEMDWRERVTELEGKLKTAQEASQQVNTQVETKVVTKTRIIKEKADTMIQYVDREIFKDREVVREVNNCPVPKEVIDVHNEAAQMNRVIEEQRKARK
jgi:hypothetical protein